MLGLAITGFNAIRRAMMRCDVILTDRGENQEAQ